MQMNLASFGSDLADLSRVLQYSATHRPVNLAGLARSIFSELRRERPGLAIAIEVPARLVVEGDAPQLRALLEALLVPAWHELAHRRRGRIEIGVATSDAGRVFFVHDDPGNMATLSPACEDDDPTRATELQRAADIVGQLGGRLCTVGVPGHGVTVLFTLPDAEEPIELACAA